MLGSTDTGKRVVPEEYHKIPHLVYVHKVWSEDAYQEWKSLPHSGLWHPALVYYRRLLTDAFPREIGAAQCARLPT